MPTYTPFDLKQQVLDYIRKNDLITGGQKLVVAVSGGPDSVCLLHILNDLRRELGIELHVAHLNHQLRGKDSEADAAYVSRLAYRLGLPVTVESRDVQAYQKKHRLSLEEAAREVRYSFLAGVAKNIGVVRVAVGHTSDDNIETILMHLLRGSGTRGLRGLLPLLTLKTAAGDMTVIRPLLELSRTDTTAYCRKHRLKPRMDITNLSPQSFRNRIRHHLLPELRRYNPRITETLLRMAGIVSDDLDYIEGEVEHLWKDVASRDKDAVIIDRKGLLSLPTALQRYLLRRAIKAVLGSLKDIEAIHVEDVLNALDKSAGRVIGLPSGLNFTVEYDRYVLAPDSISLCPLPPLEGETTLNVPGKTATPGWDILAEIITRPEFNKGEDQNTDFSACFDYDRTGKHLTVRCRQPGDRFQPLGMEHTKKLHDFMIDARIPQSWRRRVPVITSPKQIIWVAGWRIDERVKVTENSSRVLRLEFKRI